LVRQQSPPPPLSTLSLHDALPIFIVDSPRLVCLALPVVNQRQTDVGVGFFRPQLGQAAVVPDCVIQTAQGPVDVATDVQGFRLRSEDHTSELQSLTNLLSRLLLAK